MKELYVFFLSLLFGILSLGANLFAKPPKEVVEVRRNVINKIEKIESVQSFEYRKDLLSELKTYVEIKNKKKYLSFLNRLAHFLEIIDAMSSDKGCVHAESILINMHNPQLESIYDLDGVDGFSEGLRVLEAFCPRENEK